MIIYGERVVLRPSTEQDKLTIYEWLTKSDIAASMMGPPQFPDHLIPTWEEFCSDYGMTLKWLCDFHAGLLPNGNELAEQANIKAEEALLQIEQIRQEMPKKNEKKTIRMCDGKEKVIR